MDELIKDELATTVQEWRDGQRIRAIPLGHPVRYILENGQRKEEPHTVRQLQTYAYCFELIDAGIAEPPENYGAFCAMASGLSPAELSNEEKEAAESLAWKALTRGWRRALSGFAEDLEMGIRNPDRKAQA
jgi:hypothetical protein